MSSEINISRILLAAMTLLGGIAFLGAAVDRGSHLSWVVLAPYGLLFIGILLFGFRNLALQSPLLWYFLFYNLLFFVIRAVELNPGLENLKYQVVGIRPAQIASLGWDLCLFFLATWILVEIWFRYQPRPSPGSPSVAALGVPWPNLQAVFFSAALLVAVLLRFYLSAKIGYGRHTEGARSLSFLAKGLITALNASSLTILVLFFVFPLRQKIKKTVWILCVSVLLISAGTQTLMSSKSALIQILVPCSFFIFILNKASIHKTTVMLLLVSLAAVPIFFNLGKQLRANQFYLPEKNSIGEYLGALGEVSPRSLLRTQEIFDRLTGIDSVINLQQENQWIQPGVLIRLDNDLKSILNWMLPGRPFSVILTSQTYAVIYGDKKWASFFNGELYTTHLFTLYGLGYAYWGKPLCFLAIPLMVLGFVQALKISERTHGWGGMVSSLLVFNAFFWTLNASGFDEIIILQLETFVPVYLFVWGNQILGKKNLLFS